MSEIRLYDYWRSSASYRVRIALNLLDERFENIPVDLLANEQRGAAHLSRNPQGLVPTIDIDNLRLTQSLAIIEYLDETRPSAHFLPADAAGRARVRMLSYAVAMEIHPVCNLSVVTFAAEQSGGAIGREAWMQHFIGRGLRALEAMLESGAVAGCYMHGDAVTMADMCLMPQVYNARRWKVDLSGMPRIGAIAEALSAIPAFDRASPDRVRPAR